MIQLISQQLNNWQDMTQQFTKLVQKNAANPLKFQMQSPFHPL